MDDEREEKLFMLGCADLALRDFDGINALLNYAFIWIL